MLASKACNDDPNAKVSIKDTDGNKVTVEESQKYTSGTSYSDSTKLSGDSDKIVMDFVSAMTTNMNDKEEL